MNEGFVLVHMGLEKITWQRAFEKAADKSGSLFTTPKRYTIFSERTREAVVNQTNTETTKVGIKNDC